MKQKRKEILDYWNDPKVESMYDKNLIRLEIDLIKSNISHNTKILDAGCGEGEGTLEYSKIQGVTVYGVDFSETRLNKAREALQYQSNVKLLKIDLLGNYELDNDFDYVISQRFVINLMEWKLQKQVILKFCTNLKKGGKLLLLEGSVDGVNQLNKFREIFGLDPIPIKWHNFFIRDAELELFLKESGLSLVERTGLGEYFMLTRGIRPYFDKTVNWDSEFNSYSSKNELSKILKLGDNLSRLKLWIFKKDRT